MIGFGAARTRIFFFVLIALALGLVGTQFLIRDEARLESLPAGHGRPKAGPRPNINTAPDLETEIKQWSLAPPRVPCVGPRGLDLGQEDNDDNPLENAIDIPYPRPFVGSHESMGLSQTWMTAAERYGPYGWGDDKPTYGKTKVAWDSTDWAALQNQCLERNAQRFKQPVPIDAGKQRFRMREAGEEVRLPVVEPQAARHVPRTAIVFRAFEGYNYTTEDLINLRATTAETALRFGGEYTVFILVNVKDKGRDIFASEDNYRRAVRELVPAEFRSMAVLFDETLLQSWYPSIKTHITTYQVMQPLQLFGHFYPEFDHYWQLELDLRFTGHAGRYLMGMSDFAREQPRKQAIERSTWFYMPESHRSYSDLLAAVNASLEGQGGLGWGMKIDDFEPLGPRPPVNDPLDDNFEWGVGEEADFIAVGPCAHVQYMVDWAWRNWYQRLKAGTRTPRWMCQPAMGRASRTLLHAAHHAQAAQDLAVHSEATLSSFALWHGLKLVAPPHPVYQNPQWPLDKMYKLYNGPGDVESHQKPGMVGMAHGDAIYRITPYAYITTSSSFWYSSPFPDEIYDAWLSRGPRGGNASAEVPYVLWRSEDGTVYAPNMMLHPVKTNQNLVDLPAGPGPVFYLAVGGAIGLLLSLAGAGFWWWKRRGRSNYALLRKDDE
ncbi:uncharacterized protein B0H64DRAFT_142450 [Chaetomium fimeti]|uniref:Uncharacterized protein n=1 Tax=Chaetomium fimeti TaxID=1854472 RepID=A0AAE0HES0_9PEZI|nr:hypothetical protein B0H64DRAFT_142450 [Chaetomium fimeti]